MPIEPDPLSALLSASLAERQDAIEALLVSLAIEEDGLRLLRKQRGLLDRRLRALASRGSPGRGPAPGRLGLRRPPRAGPG
ncbi:MAG: hypothetical protein FJ296_07910 [Planctomycetes bacterium]|nr:hypothetical protein [Planctomycetota bacterium]